jgi:SAM-dependent methyltransferase
MKQVWDPSRYASSAGFVPAYGAPLVEMLAPTAGMRVLDVGCGDGVLTAELAARGASVVGIDASAEMIAAARARGLDARVMPAERLDFREEFDAAFSNAALHWVREQDAALAGIRRALKRGGRFVAEMGGHGNVAAIMVALRAVTARLEIAFESPYYFPSAAEYRARLERHGFLVEEIALFARPTALPTGMRGWLETFIVAMLEPAQRARVIDEVEALLAPSLRDDSGNWTADYVRLRFVARAE